MMRKSVIILESDEVLLDSYCFFINSFEDYVLKGAYRNMSVALNAYEDVKSDIIICDTSMLIINGIEDINRLKMINQSVQIIIISIHNNLFYVMDSIKEKVDGFLTKPIKKCALWSALNILDNDKSMKVLDTFQNKGYNVFSKRENEILGFLTQGLTYKSIAEELFITTSTVNFHIQNIYSKLDVKSKTEALKQIHQLKKSIINY